MNQITFDAAEFRKQFPEFISDTIYPDAALVRYFTTATCYITDSVSDLPTDCLSESCRELALNYMTAHLCKLEQLAISGKTNALVTNSSIGSVSVGTAPPPFGSSQWSWWLNTTSYGQNFQALLESCAEAGAYVGGRCERMAFRKVGGDF